MTTRNMKRLLFLYWLAATSLPVGGFILFVVTQNPAAVGLCVIPLFALIWSLTQLRCAECRFPVLYTFANGWQSWPRGLNDTDPVCRKCGAKIGTVRPEGGTAG